MRKWLARGHAGWPVAVPVLLAAALHARGFLGFWLGDDLPNLYRTHEWAQAGTLWIDTARQFLTPITGGGSFIRPMMIASLSLNYELSGVHYAGWYAFNFAVHLVNAALVALVVLRLARRLDCDGRVAALASGLVFGLNPAIAEGVYWVSARADGWVTLLSLATIAVWLRDDTRGTRQGAWVFPLFLVAALGFKESAAILPLQMTLVALAWPHPRPRGMVPSVLAGFAVVVLYFAFRAHLFGTLFQTYVTDTGGDTGWWQRGIDALRSLPAWWSGVMEVHAGLAAMHGALLAAGTVLGLAVCRGPRLRLAFAFLCAGAGLLTATLLNLGRLASSGEGGRLFYEPCAWLAIGVGLLVAHSRQAPARAAGKAGVVAILLSAALGAIVLHATLRQVSAVQNRSRALVAALAQWAADRPELTMVIVPEQQGPIVSFRNGQGSIVMPPLQARALLHLVLPTLPREIPERYDAFAQGLGTRLGKIVPQHLDATTLRKLRNPDAAHWPPVACWSPDERRIIALAPANAANRGVWIRETRAAARVCLPGEPTFRAP